MALLLALPSHAEKVLTVPLTSVVRGTGERAWIYVYDAAKSIVRRHAVTLGDIEGGRVQVIQGLTVGERLVGAGASFMVDGQPVTPYQPSTRLADGVAP